MANPLIRLQQLGQSPWHDNIRRQLLTSGTLKKMVDDGDITGLTSNPTIFEQAIGNSTDYDQDVNRLAREGKTAEQIFDALAIDDIRYAADAFAPVFERTGGNDGYVSIEVMPRLAHHTQGTTQEPRGGPTTSAPPPMPSRRSSNAPAGTTATCRSKSCRGWRTIRRRRSRKRAG